MSDNKLTARVSGMVGLLHVHITARGNSPDIMPRGNALAK